MVFVYILTAVVVLLSLFLLKNRHFFNRDIYRNYGDEKVPWIRNGFSVASFEPGELGDLFGFLIENWGQNVKLLGS
jgi:hypothetical protein